MLRADVALLPLFCFSDHWAAERRGLLEKGAASCLRCSISLCSGEGENELGQPRKNLVKAPAQNSLGKHLAVVIKDSRQSAFI